MLGTFVVKKLLTFIINDSFILVLNHIVLLKVFPGTNAKFHDITLHIKKSCPKQKVSDAK